MLAGAVPRPRGSRTIEDIHQEGGRQRWLDQITADPVTGRYVDPKAGRVLMPESEDRARAAINAALGAPAESSRNAERG